MSYRFDTAHLSGQQQAIINQKEREEKIRQEELQKKIDKEMNGKNKDMQE